MWSRAGYNEYDFMRMKQDAISQAKDMQRRAVAPSATVNPSKDGWKNVQQVPEPVKEEPQRCPNCGRTVIDGKHIYPPKNQPNAAAGTQTSSGAPKQNTNRRQNPSPQGNRNSTQKSTPKSTSKNQQNTRHQRNSAAQSGRSFTYDSPKTKVADKPPPREEQSKAPPPATTDDTTLFGKINIPILGDIDIDRDILLIGGLLLVLLTEDGDRMLMLALLYIMM